MTKNIFDVKGMSCSACSAAVQNAVQKQEGIKSAQVNLLTNTLTAEYDEKIISDDEIIRVVKNTGYDAQIRKAESVNKTIDKEEKTAKRLIFRLALSGVFLVGLMVVAMGHMVGINIMHHNPVGKGILEIILLLPILILNFKYFSSGFKALFRLNPNMDSLIAVGAAASVIYSVYQLILGGADHYYFESAGMILTFITIGKYLESNSNAKTTSAVTKLIDLSPKTSIILVDGVETEIQSKDIKKGDIVIVKGGMSFPADGIVISGNGTADESAITGESIPVEKSEGSNVTGGTILLSGYVQFEALKVGEETTLSEIIRLVEEATLTKPKIARIADKISRVFVPAVILIAIITFCIWFFLAGETFEKALTFSISVLVISCPCALGLATPTAIMVGTGKAAQMGILIKSAETFESGSKIKSVMLDKTGTITKGTPEVTDVYTECDNEIELMAICASIESMSDHPLACAVVRYADSYIPKSVLNFSSITGKGVSAEIDGDSYHIGNLNFISKYELSDKIKAFAEKLALSGKTPLYVAKNTKVVAVFGIADAVKDTSKEAIELLNADSIETIMLTGDNHKTAEAIRKQVGITKVKSELMPSEKNEIIRQYQLENPTAMVGDGINDSPALTAADVGIALGAGTDIAIESADVVLIKNDLRDVHTTLKICKKVMRNIKENLFWALIYNTIGIPIAAGVLYKSAGIQLSPMIGTIAMSLSSICVISNALRLKNIKRDFDTCERKEKNTVKTVYIEGMACGHCSARVAELLKPLDANVVVDHTKGTAVIASSADDAAIKAAVESGGYNVIKID